MATIAGTIKGITLADTSPWGIAGRKGYKVTFDIGAYTGSSDTATLAAVGAAIAAQTDNGKTITLRGAVNVFPGLDTNAQLVYTGALTVSTDALNFDLTTAAAVELTSATATTGIGLIVVVDES
jgi:hypothetical protein